MEEKIINTLLNKKNKISFTIDELMQFNKIKGSSDEKSFKKAMTKLISSGRIYYDYHNDCYMLFEYSNMYKGYLKIDDKKRYYIEDNDRKYVVSSDNLHHASYGDFVIVGYNFKKHSYEVSKVLRKDNNNYVAEVIDYDGRLCVYNQNIGTLDILDNSFNLLKGNLVFVKKNDDKAQILEVICHKDDANAQVLRVVYEHGFTNEFSDSVKDELRNIPLELSDDVINEELLKGRVDLRDRDIVTIDCDSTKDIDDAVYIEKNDDGTVSLYVSIANVSYYIKDGSSLAARIKEAGTSVYPPGCVVPMLPRELSNGICSLNPNVDRLAITFKSTFDDNGNLVSFDIFKSIINSKKKMTYSDVDKILDEGIMVDGYQDFYKQLLMMQKLYLLIQDDFYKNGYLEFQSIDLDLVLGEDEKILKIDKNIQGTGAKLIEFFMLITNKNACEYFSKKNIPLIYRVDDKPNFKKIGEVIALLQDKKYISDKINVDDDNRIYSKEEIQSVLYDLRSVEMPEVFYNFLIRSMSKAKFSTTNIGHYPLGLLNYAQFTSPIRRGGDWRNHTILDCYLDTFSASDVKKRFPIGSLFKEAEIYSNREREAEAVELEVNQMLLLEYLDRNMVNLVDISLIGRVANISSNIQILLNNGIKGTVNIPMDSFEVCDNDLLFGSNIICSVGDMVSVKLCGVNLKTKEILFTLEKNLEKELSVNEKEEEEKKVKVRKYLYNN